MAEPIKINTDYYLKPGETTEQYYARTANLYSKSESPTTPANITIPSETAVGKTPILGALPPVTPTVAPAPTLGGAAGAAASIVPGEEAKKEAPSTAAGFLKSLTDISGAAPTTTAVTREAPEIKKFAEEKKVALETEAEAKKTQYGQLEQEEIKNIEQTGTQSIGRAKNALAEMGILGTSTAGLQYLNDIQSDVDEMKNKTKSKYAIARMEIDSKTKNDLLAAVDSQIKTINESIQKRIENAREALKIGVDIYKQLSSEEIESRKNALEIAKADVDAKYKAGQLDIDEYNAQTGRLNADINAFSAETQRRKAEYETGMGRPSYDEFIAGKEKELGISIANRSDPKLLSEYNQKYPQSLSLAKKNLTTDQQSRLNYWQDLISRNDPTIASAAKGSNTSTLKYIQSMNPDLAPFLKGPGEMSLEDIIISQAMSSAGAGETPVVGSSTPGTGGAIGKIFGIK